jgi:hypothetical protein
MAKRDKGEWTGAYRVFRSPHKRDHFRSTSDEAQAKELAAAGWTEVDPSDQAAREAFPDLVAAPDKDDKGAGAKVVSTSAKTDKDDKGG